MSQENVGLLHQAIDAFNRRDLDAFLALMGSGVEFTPYERAVEGLGPYRGHDGVRTWWSDSFETLPDLSAELYEVRDLVWWRAFASEAETLDAAGLRE
jgi:hypothetical protein